MEFEKWAANVPSGEINRVIFGGLDEKCDLRKRFGNINCYIYPQIGHVATYSVNKARELLKEKTVCEIENPAEREEHDLISGLQIVFSDLHRIKLITGTEIVFFLDAYRKLKKRKKESSRIHEGIGMCFLKYIADYNNILKILLRQPEAERTSLFRSINLKGEGKFIDLYLGQSVYTSFVAWADGLPRMRYRRLIRV